MEPALACVSNSDSHSQDIQNSPRYFSDSSEDDYCEESDSEDIEEVVERGRRPDAQVLAAQRAEAERAEYEATERACIASK